MSALRHYKPHYKHSDYLAWQGDWELWFGTAIAMTPSPFAPHERAVSELAYQLQSGIKSCGCPCVVYTGLDWVVQDDTVVRPDLMIVCGQQPTDYLRRPPKLIVEVLSPSTAEKDLGPKRELYQQQRVEHYLIVDPDSQRLTRFGLSESLIYVESANDPGSFRLTDDCVIELVWPV